MGIEPTSEAWEATNNNLKTLELRTAGRRPASSELENEWKMKSCLYIGKGLPFCGKPRYSRILKLVTSQIFSGRQNKNALNPLAEIRSKVPKVPQSRDV